MDSSKTNHDSNFLPLLFCFFGSTSKWSNVSLVRKCEEKLQQISPTICLTLCQTALSLKQKFQNDLLLQRHPVWHKIKENTSVSCQILLTNTNQKQNKDTSMSGENGRMLVLSVEECWRYLSVVAVLITCVKRYSFSILVADYDKDWLMNARMPVGNSGKDEQRSRRHWINNFSTWSRS